MFILETYNSIISPIWIQLMAPDVCQIARTPSPFHIAEYQAVNSDIEANHKIGFNVVIYATIANGFMMAWILQYFQTSPPGKFSHIIAIAMPIVLTFFAILKFRHTLARMKFNFMYIYKMEEIYRELGLGYQHFYRTSDDSKYLKHSHIAYLALGVQLFLLLVFSYLILFGLL